MPVIGGTPRNAQGGFGPKLHRQLYKKRGPGTMTEHSPPSLAAPRRGRGRAGASGAPATADRACAVLLLSHDVGRGRKKPTPRAARHRRAIAAKAKGPPEGDPRRLSRSHDNSSGRVTLQTHQVPQPRKSFRAS